MNEFERERFEKRLNSLAKGFEYPLTPVIAAKVMKQIQPTPRRHFNLRPLAWSLVIIVIMFSTLMLIPPARAAILEFIQIGVVRIFPGSSQETPMPNVIPSPTSSLPSMLPFLNEVAGRTTLASAQERVSYQILLPTYPAGLGEP